MVEPLLSSPDLAITTFDVIGPLLIFAARVLDVSIGTVRNIYTIRGQRALSLGLGFIESLIFLTAISGVLSSELNVPRMIGYAGGYACGIYVGITVESWIASGYQIVRVIAKDSPDLAATLRDEGWPLTQVTGEGRDGPTAILFLVMRRRRVPALLHAIRRAAPSAFITVESAGKVIGGVANVAAGTALRK